MVQRSVDQAKSLLLIGDLHKFCMIHPCLAGTVAQDKVDIGFSKLFSSGPVGELPAHPRDRSVVALFREVTDNAVPIIHTDIKSAAFGSGSKFDIFLADKETEPVSES